MSFFMVMLSIQYFSFCKAIVIVFFHGVKIALFSTIQSMI
jgi:hypothetical protein